MCCEDENFKVMDDTRASRSSHGGLMSYTYGEAPAATYDYARCTQSLLPFYAAVGRGSPT